MQIRCPKSELAYSCKAILIQPETEVLLMSLHESRHLRSKVLRLWKQCVGHRLLKT